MKSRTSSAFLAFGRNVLTAFLWAAAILIFELSFLNLWPVINQEFGHWQIWFLPGCVLLFVLIYWSLKRPLTRTILILAGFAAVLSGWFFYGQKIQEIASAYVLDLRISEQKNAQTDQPLYENSEQISESPLLVYWTDDPETEEVLDDGSKEQIAMFIEQLPDVLTRYGASIYLMEDEAFLRECSDIEKNGNVYGVSSTAEAAANIRIILKDPGLLYTYLKDGSTVLLSDPAFYHETIVHELTHLLDYYSTGVQELKSHSSQIEQFYQNNPYQFGEYGASSREEYFAEAGVYYFLYPDLMQENAPEVYAFFVENYPV